MTLSLKLLSMLLSIGLVLVATAQPLQSPKGKEQAASMGSPRAIVVPPHYFTNSLTWTGTYTQAVAFSVEFKPELNQPWTVIGNTTNVLSFSRLTTNSHGFYRVGAFWP